MRKYSAEDWLLVIAGVLIIVVAALFISSMAGCSLQKQEAYSVKLTKGCHIEVRVADSESAGKVAETISLKECEVSHTEDKEK